MVRLRAGLSCSRIHSQYDKGNDVGCCPKPQVNENGECHTAQDERGCWMVGVSDGKEERGILFQVKSIASRNPWFGFLG
jgi:hypothetical protein